MKTFNDMKTEYLLFKGNITCRTKNLQALKLLRLLGWKIKLNELSNLI